MIIFILVNIVIFNRFCISDRLIRRFYFKVFNMAYKTVTIGCKLPNGILLQVGQEVMNINGMDHSGNDEFAMTANVPEHFWLAWLNSNKDLDIVKNGQIFAHADCKHIEVKSKNRRAKKISNESLANVK